MLLSLRNGSACDAVLFWGLVTGAAGFFFEVYATGGVDEGFAVWRYDQSVLTAASSASASSAEGALSSLTGGVRLLPAVPFFKTAPISAFIGYTGSGLCIFGAAFLQAQLRGAQRRSGKFGAAGAEAPAVAGSSSGTGEAYSLLTLAGKWKRGLFTGEDPNNFHKAFGAYCLVHFLYRFVHTEFLLFDPLSPGGVGVLPGGSSSSVSSVSSSSSSSSDMAFAGGGWSIFAAAEGAGAMVVLLSLLPHALLSASSLIFRIPKRRIKEGSRIWPEYRLHSIVFAYRSVACMAVTWAEARWLSKDVSSV